MNKWFTIFLIAISFHTLADEKKKTGISPELVAKGKYLSTAANCYSCHTSSHSAPFTGDVAFETPFGTIYSTNITPDRKTGIGSYSEKDFLNAMKHGYSSIRGYLYPAFPYTSYQHLSDDDVKAMWAYFKSLKPIYYENKSNDLMFPANIRLGLLGWNLFFMENTSYKENKDKTSVWNRGNYVSNALGHCGECHNPRNFAQAMDLSRHYQGNHIEGWLATDITPKELRQQGWSKYDLMTYLKKGHSRQGIPAGSMGSVVHNSTSHLSDDDLNAMATYLLDIDSDSLPEKQYHRINKDDMNMPGYTVYATYCAGCHGKEGQGFDPGAPAMMGNGSNTLTDPYQSVAFILRGLPAKRYSLTVANAYMPAYVNRLNSKEIADLVTFMRTVWGGQKEPVTPKYVEKVKERLKDENWLYRHSEH